MSIVSHHHQSVMLDECLAGLNIVENGCYVDATLGRGGHSLAILDYLNDDGCLISFDKDKEAIDYIKTHCNDKRFMPIHNSFTQLSEVLEQHQKMGKVNGILMDLGVSSPQLDNAQRGFSFLRDGPLDMRMDIDSGLSVADWLAEAEEKEIADVLYQFGEEKKSRKIARAIKIFQQKHRLTTTKQLAELVEKVIPKFKQKKHPATRTFQALRIFINKELEDLQNVLEQLIDCLAIDGRIVIMSFHSLEDRIVKQFIIKYSKVKQRSKYLPIIDKAVPMPLQSIKRLFASDAELACNIRARSAVLRIAQKVCEKTLSQTSH